MKPSHFISKSTSWLYVCLICLFLLSCRGSGHKDKNVSEFKPEPKKIEKQQVNTLQIGEEAPDFNLPDISGEFFTLNDFKKADVLVIIFTCNHCPTAQAYEDRIIRFTNDYKNKGVQLVAIMPTSVFGLLLEECGYSDLDDTYESMIIRAKDKGFNFPYLYDGDDQGVSIKYGPVATPHAFVFDRDRKLQYVGRIDASEKPGTANAEDLRAAVDAVLNDRKVENPVNKAFGCSIKWSWKTEWTEKVNNEWNSREIVLNKINLKQLEELKKNTSDKLLLLNIWATWCAPCVLEYPELVKLQRMYGNRAFKFVSVSADNPDAFEKAYAFLKSKHSALDNYIFDGQDKYVLIETVDPDWDGALPYSLLIEPGGNIVFTSQGIVDLLELKKKIVENPLLGRYY
jgi:thiol-disulfide isomerase/thioredoxin